MTNMPDNVLHLAEYTVLNIKEIDDGLHFHVEAPKTIILRGMWR